ncbi:glycosyl hydrolase family 18 protein [Streptomyces natalensis]|uniref:Glycosyl hydrolase n=1 Tax=Streptomyces natalensis ATCC 27448 TaxID=1240678 RepID=A0A0D7CM83_9ACTN|nr:glycosyl hydrolase family 18 protein [Streptomyces natalensis]KIZ17283.1 glycosyl hydrolase [Streptomyces natalensis ATCC 27448]
MDHVSVTRARPGFALLLAAVALAGPLAPAAVAAASPGTEAGVALAAADRRTGSAWLPYWGDTEAAYQDALEHADQLRTVSPFWYEATADAVRGQDGAGDEGVIDGLHRAGIRVVPTVTEKPGPAEMAGVIHDPRRRAAHIDALLETAGSRAYDGMDLDYETMTLTNDRAARERVRTGFNLLTRDLCARLHARGKECVVTVLAQTGGSGEAYDYRQLGKVADTVRIMGYDLHWAGGAAGPLSSKDWYEQFLRYATATIPRNKIEVGFPGYGWDWTKGSTNRAGHLTWKEAEALRRRTGSGYHLDDASGTPHFTYLKDGTEHQVWYQDARGVAEQLPLLKKYGVQGTGLWALGFEDPEVWPVFRGQ